MTDKEAYYFRKENHRCVDCGRRVRGKGVRCEECKRIATAKQTQRLQNRRDNHQCLTCGTPIKVGAVRCPECMAKAKKKKRERYKYCKDNGLCINCMAPNGNGKVFCDACREITNAKARERYRGLSDDAKVEKIKYSSNYIAKHPDKMAEYNRRYREKMKKEGLL